MSEFYIKSAEPAGGDMLRVNISSFKGRSDVELIAEHGGEIIGSTKVNLSIGENIAELALGGPAPHKISLKLYYRGFATNYFELELPPGYA